MLVYPAFKPDTPSGVHTAENQILQVVLPDPVAPITAKVSPYARKAHVFNVGRAPGYENLHSGIPKPFFAFSFISSPYSVLSCISKFPDSGRGCIGPAEHHKHTGDPGHRIEDHIYVIYNGKNLADFNAPASTRKPEQKSTTAMVILVIRPIEGSIYALKIRPSAHIFLLPCSGSKTVDFIFRFIKGLDYPDSESPPAGLWSACQ